MTGRLIINAVSSYGQQFVALAVLFLLTPYIVTTIGTEDYGLWVLIQSIVGFLPMMEMGFSVSTVKFVAECRGRGENAIRNRIVSTLFGVYLILAAAAVLVLFGIATYLNEGFDIPAAQASRSVAVFWVAALYSVITVFLAEVFHGALVGELKQYLVNGIRTFSTILYGLLGWGVLAQGYGLTGLALANLVAVGGSHVAFVVLAYRCIPDLRVSLRLFDREVLGRVTSFSGHQFLINLAGAVYKRKDPMIIKLFLPLSAVAVYGIANRIADRLDMLLRQLVNAFTPFIAELNGAGHDDRVRELFLRGTRFAAVFALFLAVPLWAYAGDAIRFWVGPDFAESGPVLVLLIVAFLISVPRYMAENILNHTGHHRYLSAVGTLSAGLSCALSLLLVSRLGMAGVVWGSVLTFVGVGAVTVMKACASCDVGVRDFIAAAIVPVGAPSAASLAAILCVDLAGPPSGLLAIGARSLLAGGTFLVVFWFLGTEENERDYFAERIGRGGRMLWRPAPEQSR